MAESPAPNDTASGPAGPSIAAGAAKAPVPVSLPLRHANQPPATEAKTFDITEKFTKACNALETGQLVKDEFFTLFESIGALEIMDPKMDSGFLKPGETLEDKYDTLQELLPEELLGIMDQLLCYEMAWHTGYPLSQTLLTSVYIDKLLWPEPKSFEQAQFYRGSVSNRPDFHNQPLLGILRAYCLALVKCCDFAIAKVMSRDYYEEEDFCTHTYNRVLFSDWPEWSFKGELDAALECISDIEFNMDSKLANALNTRLLFRSQFLEALALDNPLDRLKKFWPPVLASLEDIKDTHHLAKAVPGAFSPKIQRRLASTVPPRPIVEIEFNDAYEKLKQLCLDCNEATRFVDVAPDPLEYMSFLQAFAARSPAPIPYARSYLATILFNPATFTSTTERSVPQADLRNLVFPCSPVTDPSNWTLSPPLHDRLPRQPRLQFATLLDEFNDRVEPCYADLWICLGQNRCRLRRQLGHVILSWDQLQADAGIIDDDLTRASDEMGIGDQVIPYPLTTWVYHKKLWMIERMVLLGFEQDIYLPDEYAGMYYFLSSISRKRTDILNAVNAHYDSRLSFFLTQKPPQRHEAAEVQESGKYIESLIAEATGTSELAASLFRFYSILLYLGKMPLPRRPFSTEELRYELRMKPFLTLQPPEVEAFAEFDARIHAYGPYSSPSPEFANDIRDPASNLWRGVEDSIKRAKESFAQLKKLGAAAAKAKGVENSWGKDIQGVLASCISLGVGVVGLKGAVEGKDGSGAGDVGVRVELPEMGTGKRYAESWIVGKVVKI